MKFLSLNTRTRQDQMTDERVPLTLVRIRHPETSEVIRLSTDPTERLRTIPQLEYGTRSTWLTSPVSNEYKFALLSAGVPDDKAETPPSATLVFHHVSNYMSTLIRSTKQKAKIDMAVVYNDSPDFVEYSILGMLMVNVDINKNEVIFSMSKAPLHAEPYPPHRMSKYRFPGLHA